MRELDEWVQGVSLAVSRLQGMLRAVPVHHLHLLNTKSLARNGHVQP